MNGILIMDNQPRSRLTVKSMFEAGGFPVNILEAADGDAAVQILKKQQVDCVLIDYLLFKENKHLILKSLQEQRVEIPVIMLTEGRDEPPAVEMMKSGAADYLAKDRLSPEILIRAVRHAIQISQAEARAEMAREAQRKTEAYTRTIIENIPDAIITIDGLGIINSFNPAAERMFGYPKHQMVGQNILLLMEGHLARDISLRSYLTKEGTVTESFGKRKDGGIFPIEISVSAMKIGDNSRFIFIIRDISPRKRMERRDAVLHQAALMVLEEKPVNEIVQFISQQLIDLFAIDGGWIGLKEPQGTVRVIARAGEILPCINEISLRWDDVSGEHGPCTLAIRTGQMQVMQRGNVLSGFCRQQAGVHRVRSIAAFPLAIRGQVLGVLVLCSRKKFFFNPGLITQLDNFSGQVAIALHAASARQHLLLLTTALEAADNAVVISDREGIIQWFNPSFLRLTGYSAGEALGQKTSLLKSGKQDRFFYQELWKKILAGKVWHGEIVNRHKSSDHYTEEMTITPVRDERGEIVNFIAIKQDVTERKKAEEILQRYQLLSERVNDIILMADSHGRLIEANGAAERAYGYRREELLSLHLADLRDPETLAVYKDQLKQAVARGALFETSHRRKDGSTFPVEVSSLGAVIGGKQVILSIIRNITARKKAEAEMLEARQQLMRAERMASLGTMSAGIAHEINQPLNSLKVMVDGMLYWYKRGRMPSMDKMIDNLEKISQQTLRIENIIRNMRSLVRSKNMSGLLPCNVNRAVEGALAMVKDELSTHKIKVIKNLQMDLPPICGQETRVEEIILNLLINAIQALDAVKLQKKEISCATWQEQHRVILEIRDTGPGISQEISPKIFEPFYTTKPVGEGMGLGLSIVHSIVNSLNGHIYLASSPKGGAAFRVEFPLFSLRESNEEYEPVGTI
ncbi:PAS domain S-box protein [Desulforamulus ruminis]|uniref:PAS domain S-box protein n=1 Tax=Desulforamulus ruminis TaxID=1564 RepID=UPI002FDB907C